MPIDVDSALCQSTRASLGILAISLSIGNYTDINVRNVCMWSGG